MRSILKKAISLAFSASLMISAAAPLSAEEVDSEEQRNAVEELKLAAADNFAKIEKYNSGVNKDYVKKVLPLAAAFGDGAAVVKLIEMVGKNGELIKAKAMVNQTRTKFFAELGEYKTTLSQGRIPWDRNGGKFLKPNTVEQLTQAQKLGEQAEALSLQNEAVNTQYRSAHAERIAFESRGYKSFSVMQKAHEAQTEAFIKDLYKLQAEIGGKAAVNNAGFLEAGSTISRLSSRIPLWSAAALIFTAFTVYSVYDARNEVSVSGFSQKYEFLNSYKDLLKMSAAEILGNPEYYAQLSLMAEPDFPEQCEAATLEFLKARFEEIKAKQEEKKQEENKEEKKEEKKEGKEVGAVNIDDVKLGDMFRLVNRAAQSV